MILADIQTVQEMTGGYLVNGNMSVPPGHDIYILVIAWIAAGNTPTPAPVDPLAEAKAEIRRIAAALPQGVQQVTLDDDGEAVVSHGINSLWYCVFAQPVDCNMPNVYVEKSANSFSILNGKKNEIVAYYVKALLPPAGSENLIFSNS